MENLDAKIDVLGREKLFSLIQENSVRFKKINIRQTKNNNKNSIEHLDELVTSYERLLRSMPLELMNIEHTIRLKFLAPLEEERKIRILTSINQEMELILEQMVTKFQNLYKVKRCEEDFNVRMEKTRLRCKENVDKQMEKLVQKLQTQLAASKSISPAQLEEKYGIDQEALNQLHLVKVLQDINSIFDALKNKGIDEVILNTVHEAIIERVKIGKVLEKMLPPAHKVAARKEWRMRVAKESVRLKEMILSIYTLAGQIQNPKEQRNYDVINKNWNRIEETFGDVPEDQAEIVMSKIKPYYHLLISQNQ